MNKKIIVYALVFITITMAVSAGFLSTTVRYNPSGWEDDGSVIRATGSVSFDYLQREAEGLTGVTDLGRFGTTWDIEERDFIEEMKSRLAGIDMKKMAEKSWDGYWERAQFIDLPDTDEGRMLKIDPSFVITRNVFAPSGEIIARRGQVYNPLK
ncbi:hypothetical protein LCGC14_3085270, partial [marine sediment metagenome]